MLDAGSKARAQWQERVAKMVWGTLFVTMGVLFTLQDMGRINLGEVKKKFTASNVVDGDAETRWSSAFSDAQWLSVDLGESVHVGQIRLYWEAAYAKEYEIQVSGTGLVWTTVRRVTQGLGGMEEQQIDATARFIRLNLMRRATPYGYSLWEVKVFDSDGNLVSNGKTASASSSEDESPYGLWLRFWPLFLIATGLPLLIAPRDDTNQVVGMAFTAVGILLEFQALGKFPWGFQQTAALVLVLVGLVILYQARPRPGDAGPQEGSR
jgi:hypothetical protein